MTAIKRISLFLLASLGISAHSSVAYTKEFSKDANRSDLEFKPAIETEIDYRDKIPSESSQGVMDEPKDLMKELTVPVRTTNIEGDPGSF